MKKFIAHTAAAVALAGGAALGLPAAHANAVVPNANVVVAKYGQQSATVLSLQKNLVQDNYLSYQMTTGYFGSMTKAAVSKYQSVHHLPVTGTVTNSLFAQIKSDAVNGHPLVPASCKIGRTLCVNQTTHRMYWMINGKVISSYNVRTGRPGYVTRDGLWHIYMKSPNWYSTIYHVSMPYSQFFSGGEAVHYSADFTTNGYGVGSHGCVNMNTYSGAKWLYNQTRIGDRVDVYHS